jgi:hypothetical protein
MQDAQISNNSDNMGLKVKSLSIKALNRSDMVHITHLNMLYQAYKLPHYTLIF